MNPNAKKSFRGLLKNDGIIVAPGAYDAFSGRLIEAAGFKAVFVGGGNIYSVMGYPDGVSTRTEYLGRVREIVDAIETPVVLDIDTGFGSGSAIDLITTIRECERIGVAAVHFEDQVTAIKAPGFKEPYVIPQGEMLKKIEAALEARKDKNFVLIARTDSRTRYGLEEALERGRAYAKAGADMVVVNALQNVDELKRAVDYVDAPLMIYNGAIKPGGRLGYKLSDLAAGDLEKIGVKLVTFGNGILRTVGRSIQELLEEIKRTGTDNGFVDRMMSKEEQEEVAGAPAFEALRERFLPAFPTNENNS